MSASAETPTESATLFGRLSSALNYFDTPLGRYRMAVASRAIVAIFGGYLLAVSLAAVIAHAMIGMEVARNDAVLTGNMLGFIAHAIAAMWAFGCANARRAWGAVVLPGVLLGLLALQLTRGVAAA